MYQKKQYLDLMEQALEAYSYDHILNYFHTVKTEGLTEHGFARLTSNIGILIAKGRKHELLPIFMEMMDFCCETMPKVKAANDFTIKEILFCIMALEDPYAPSAGIVSAADIARWKAHLSTVIPQTCYTQYAVTPKDEVHNWALFTAVSEYIRNLNGLGNTEEFIDIQLASQLQWMDENGMYRDPNEPMVYDLVPRGLFSVLLHFGYRGKYYDEIDKHLKKAGLMTLKMQSVTGEIAFGGRSNQFPHNESQQAIICEFEARRYAAEGNTALAGQFKAAAGKALENISYWLAQKPTSHVKNRFPINSKYGCEEYAYFDKYMITAASFLYAAYLICDETIEEAVTDRCIPYTMQTSEHFHKIFLNAGGYFLEFDTQADMHYDASGLGRVHKIDAPSTICMSVPCSAAPHYTIDVADTINLSLCPGIIDKNVPVFASDPSYHYELTKLSETDSDASADFLVTLPDGQTVSAAYKVSESGVAITVSGCGEVVHMLPAFCFDGETAAVVTAKQQQLTITYKGYSCRYTTNGEIIDTGKIGCNRNGHYLAYYAKATGSLTVTIEIFTAC